MRIVWKDIKKGKVVGKDLQEVELWAIKERVREMFEGKNIKGFFLLDGLNKRSTDWTWGVQESGRMFGSNKMILDLPLRYNYIYNFYDHKLYKVVGEL